MSDNTEESKPEESAAASDEPVLNSDQNFTYWITMLPFLAIAGVFVFNFSKTHGDYKLLINAAGAVVLGILVASIVNALSQGSENKNADGTPGETPKPAGGD